MTFAMFADLAEGLGGVALFALPGLAWTRLFPGLRDLPLPRRLAYAYLLGIAAMAGGLYALSFLFGIPLRQAVIFTVAALPLSFFLIRRDAPSPGRGKLGRLALLSVAVGSLISLAVFAEAVTRPLEDWDGRMTWTAQARWIRAAEEVRPRVLEEARWYVSLPRYPVLLPIAQVAVMESFRAEPDHQVFRALYAAFFPVLLLVLWDGARRWAGRRAAALAVLAACGLPLLSFWKEGGAGGAYSDLPLACFYGAALILLLRPSPRLADGVAAGLLLGAAILTKQEGVPLAAAALLAATIPLLRHRAGWRRLAAAGAIAALALTFLAAWQAGIPDRGGESYSHLLSVRSLWPGVIARVPRLAPRIARCMAEWSLWRGFWAVAPLALLAGWRGLRRRAALPLLLAAAAPPAVAWAAYTVHPDPGVLADVTWNRMLVQASIPLLLLLSLALRDLCRRSRLARDVLHFRPRLEGVETS